MAIAESQTQQQIAQFQLAHLPEQYDLSKRTAEQGLASSILQNELAKQKKDFDKIDFADSHRSAKALAGVAAGQFDDPRMKELIQNISTPGALAQVLEMKAQEKEMNLRSAQLEQQTQLSKAGLIASAIQLAYKPDATPESKMAAIRALPLDDKSAQAISKILVEDKSGLGMLDVMKELASEKRDENGNVIQGPNWSALYFLQQSIPELSGTLPDLKTTISPEPVVVRSLKDPNTGRVIQEEKQLVDTPHPQLLSAQMLNNIKKLSSVYNSRNPGEAKTREVVQKAQSVIESTTNSMIDAVRSLVQNRNTAAPTKKDKTSPQETRSPVIPDDNATRLIYNAIP
jgi:hypothetical protein